MKTQATPKTDTVKKTSTRSSKATVQPASVKTAASPALETQNRMTVLWPPAGEIATRAYKIWQQQGCPDGCEEKHWWQAEQEILREGALTFAH